MPESHTTVTMTQRPKALFGRRPLVVLLVLFFLGDWLGAGLSIYFAVAPGNRAANLPDIFSDWAWWIVALTALVVLWYGRGVRRLSKGQVGVSPVEQVLVYLGIFFAFSAVVPPVDVMADDLYFMHQIQHMLLHMVAPMLLSLGAPLAPLIAGLPRPLKRHVLKPLVRSSAARRVWAFLAHPLVSSALFIAALCFWQIPRFIDLLAVSDSLDEFAHVTMLVTGLFFWWMLLDPRARPGAVSYPTRLAAVTITMFATILVGAYIAFSTHALYPVYATRSPDWGISPSMDQTLGGLVTWIDGAMTEVMGGLIIFHRWLKCDSSRPVSQHRRIDHASR